MASAPGLDRRSLLKPKNGLSTRLLIHNHFVRRRGLTMTEVAAFFNVSVHAVSKGVKRLDRMTATDNKLQAILKEISNVET